MKLLLRGHLLYSAFISHTSTVSDIRLPPYLSIASPVDSILFIHCDVVWRMKFIELLMVGHLGRLGKGAGIPTQFSWGGLLMSVYLGNRG